MTFRSHLLYWFRMHSMKIKKMVMPEGHGAEQLRKLRDYLPELCLLQGPWLAGGTVRRMVSDEPVDGADLDYFFSGYEPYKIACDKIERVADAKLQTQLATTYRVPIGDSHQIVQFIKKEWYNGILALFTSFDFRVCQFATDGESIVYPELAMQDLKEKRLCVAYKGNIHNEGMHGRLFKYLNYGFRPDNHLIINVLARVRSASGAVQSEMAEEQTYSDTRPNAPNPTGLGPGWKVLAPKVKISG